MRVFLDAGAISLAMDDAAVRSKFRHIRGKGIQLFTSTSVAGEMQQLMMEKGKESNFLFVETLHQLQISILPPKAGLVPILQDLDTNEKQSSDQRISMPDQVHLALAKLWNVDLYVTTRAQARSLSNLLPFVHGFRIIDVDTFFHQFLRNARPM